ncbi:MAG TPA: hypothetical protein VFK02_05965 [Kofleriaceae bacterium]|nr:hypothetical protein [Kofleriaceae bacterium]
MCEANGACSQPDPSCPSGRRFGDGSGQPSDPCVPGGEAAPDACVQQICSPDGVPTLADPEGGNIMFEHITVDTQLHDLLRLPGGQNTVMRVMAYFMSAQTPDSNPLPTQGTCTNLVTTKGWPLTVGTPHTDVDVGTLTVVGKNAAGQDVSLDVPKQPAGRDQIDRPHDLYYQLVRTDAASLPAPDSFYDVKFGGSATVPATTFKDAIYLASGYTEPLAAPDLENNGPLDPDKDFPVQWTSGASANKPAADRLVSGGILGIVWLLDVNDSPTHMCVVPDSANQFTIPSATIAEYKAAAMARGRDTAHAILRRSAVAHQVVRLPLTAAPDATRRIDMISIKSYSQRMDVK